MCSRLCWAVDCASAAEDLQYGCQPSRFQSMWVWDGVYSVLGCRICTGNELGISSTHPKPSRTSTHPSSSSPKVAQKSLRAKNKNSIALQAGCTHSSARALIAASSHPVKPSQHPRHRYFAVLQASHHASTKTTSTALVHPCTLSSAHTGEHRKTTEYRKTTVDAPASGHFGPAARQGLGLRAQARQGLRRRPPQRHGHGPGRENCGARCGRSQR